MFIDFRFISLLKVVCAPYKPNAFLAYNRILNAPLRILKDCIQLMRLEMVSSIQCNHSYRFGVSLFNALVSLIYRYPNSILIEMSNGRYIGVSLSHLVLLL